MIIGVVVILLVVIVIGSGIKHGVCRKTQLNSIGCNDVAVLESGRIKLENEREATGTDDNRLLF